MQKQTTTEQIKDAIKSKLLILEDAEIYNKNNRKTEAISNDGFLESLDFLCETVFASCVGWSFGRNCNTGRYEIDCSRMDSNSDAIVTAYFRKGNNVTDQDIKDALLKIEEEE